VTKQYASQRSWFSLFKLSSRLLNERIQLSGLEIRLDLLIPHTRVELKEPGPKLRQILGERFDIVFSSCSISLMDCPPSCYFVATIASCSAISLSIASR
jgi:hypothetical protein